MSWDKESKMAGRKFNAFLRQSEIKVYQDMEHFILLNFKIILQ